MADTGDDQVGWLNDLNARDAALVRAFRNAAVALGHDSDDHRDAALADLDRLAATPERETAEHSFWALMATIGNGARRQIRYHAPQCPCLGEDEVAFLSVCEHLRRGERAQATACANLLVAGEAAGRLVHHAAVVARCCRALPGSTPAGATRRPDLPDPPGLARLH